MRLMGYSEREIERIAERPPAPVFPLTASAALELASWYLRYGLDRLDSDPRCQHPAVRTHAIAACAQHNAITNALKLSKET